MPGLDSASSPSSEGVRVVVTPSQSSFFAGEPFSVTVTFTNTRSPEAGPSRTPHTHKRGAHSISSAPLARPPTSPGLPPPRTPNNYNTNTNNLSTVHLTPNSPHTGSDAPASVRRGLIGKSPVPVKYNGQGKGTGTDDTELPELLEQRRKRLLAKSKTKSLSVSIAPHEVEEQLSLSEAAIAAPLLPKSAGYVNAYGYGYTDPRIPPTSPRVSSPLTRSDALPLSAKHPHARKPSVLDGGRAEIVSTPMPYAYSNSNSNSTTTPASSASTFSLALDPIVEGVSSPYPSTPSLASPIIEIGSTTPTSNSNSNSVYAYPTRRQHQSQSHLGLGLGHPQKGSPYSSTSALSPSPRSPSTSAFAHAHTHPNTELILYSYIKLQCTLHLSPSPLGSLPPAQRTTLAATRAALLKRTVVGGGRMDISASVAGNRDPSSPATILGHGHARAPGHRRRPTHNRSSSFSAGLLNLLSPNSAGPSGAGHSALSPAGVPPSPRSASYTHHRRHPSTAGVSPLTPSFPGQSPSSTSPGVGLGIGIGIPDANLSSPSVNGHARAPHSGHSGSGEYGYAADDVDANADPDVDVDPDAPLPVFEVQPAMLAVDLVLAPGESRSYTYTLLLPDVLPPTFRGRAIKFAYELEVGTCRAGTGTGSASAGSVSRVMKVPIRVYNNVVVGRPLRPYDILWPLSSSKSKSAGVEMQGVVVEEPSVSVSGAGKAQMQMQVQMKRLPGPGARTGAGPSQAVALLSPQQNLTSQPQSQSQSTPLTGTYSDLQDYARRLLGSFPDPDARGVRIKLPAEAISPVPLSAGGMGEWTPPGQGQGRREREAHAHVDPEEGRRMEREMEREMERMERAEEGGLSGCREAVEILTRNPKKASYDVNKDGVKVAVLTFTKAAYRLGETVLGVVEINQRTSRARVLQLSAILEAHESLPSPISPSSAGARPATLRRVHAEHHAAFISSTLRTTFSLDIPSDAAPAFLVRVAPPQPGAPPTTFGGLEWKVRLCLLVAVASEDTVGGTEGVRVKGMVRDGAPGYGAGAGGKGAKGGWGSSWRACDGIAPMEKVKPKPKPKLKSPKGGSLTSPTQAPTTPMGWGAFFAASLFGRGETTEDENANGEDGDAYLGPADNDKEEYEEEEDEEDEDEWYDGIKPNLAGGVGVGVNFGGGDEGWRDVKVETVECEVPIKMWPGNTAFKAQDIVFDV